MEIPIDELSRLVSYDPITGNLYRVKGAGPAKDGQPCSHAVNNNGYRRVKINYKRYYQHRVAWALHFGEWPSGLIDHINGNREDNRIVNLREADHELNGRNSKQWSTNKSGCVGVCRFNGYWLAYIGIGKRKTKRLGKFESFAAAVAARKNAERELGYSGQHGVRA